MRKFIKYNTDSIIFFSTLVLFLTTVIIMEYLSSCRSADIFNEINGASYSCSDFLLAEDQINSQTKTINIR